MNIYNMKLQRKKQSKYERDRKLSSVENLIDKNTLAAYIKYKHD